MSVVCRWPGKWNGQEKKKKRRPVVTNKDIEDKQRSRLMLFSLTVVFLLLDPALSPQIAHP